MTDEADEALAKQAALGNARAFDVLIRRYKAPLYRFARRYAGDPDDAFDIVQESFVAAWRSLGRFDTRRSFATWIKAIALNKCRDLARRKRTRQMVLRALALGSLETAAPEPDYEADGRPERLDRAIAALPTIHKEPLLLTTVGGLSQSEAAALLGVSAKAVEMRLRRARQKLAEILRASEG